MTVDFVVPIERQGYDEVLVSERGCWSYAVVKAELKPVHVSPLDTANIFVSNIIIGDLGFSLLLKALFGVNWQQEEAFEVNVLLDTPVTDNELHRRTSSPTWIFLDGFITAVSHLAPDGQLQPNAKDQNRRHR